MRNHTAAVAAAAIRALLIITLAAVVGGCPPADNNASGVGAPDAVDDGPFNIVEDSTATAIGVTANDTEPDGQALTIIAVSSPSGGTAVINGLNINYTPFADFS
ncbi:MAG: Ig-like domain-containing protein, partial [Planctomycetota bacterium]